MSNEKEFVNSPILFKADTRYLHFRIESLLHSNKDNQRYYNLKLLCFKTDKNDHRIDLAEFFLNYRVLRGIIYRMKRIDEDRKLDGLCFEWNFTSNIPSAKNKFRNLVIRYTRNKQLLFIFNDGKYASSDEYPNYTGKIIFPLNLVTEQKIIKANKKEVKVFEINSQLAKFDEWLQLPQSINNWEIVASREIFKPVEKKEKNEQIEKNT